jgi:hypothetical protein
MSTTTKTILGIALTIIILIGGMIGYVISSKFTAERFEQSVFAQDEQMRNTWSMMEGTLKTQGFTVKNYSEEFIKSIKANAKRYENDKGGMMKWIQESKNQMSPEAHKKLMDTVEKVYAKKEARQASKISVVQSYRTFMTSSVKGTIATVVFNYPTDKAKKIMDRIISTKSTKETWETGEDSVINPFKK